MLDGRIRTAYFQYIIIHMYEYDMTRNIVSELNKIYHFGALTSLCNNKESKVLFFLFP
jgi:hypothetical protein